MQNCSSLDTGSGLFRSVKLMNSTGDCCCQVLVRCFGEGIWGAVAEISLGIRELYRVLYRFLLDFYGSCRKVFRITNSS